MNSSNALGVCWSCVLPWLPCTARAGVRACCRGYHPFLPSLLAVPVAASPSHDACSASFTCPPDPASGRTMVSRHLSFFLSLSLSSASHNTGCFLQSRPFVAPVCETYPFFFPSQASRTYPTRLVSGSHGVRRVGMAAMPPISRNGSSQCYKRRKHYSRVMCIVTVTLCRSGLATLVW